MRRGLTALALAAAISGSGAMAAAPAPGAPAAQPITLASLKELLAGTWQSASDPRFIRELDANGQAIDRYEGEDRDALAGSWTIFLGSAPPAKFAGRTLDAKSVYLELDQEGDTLLFALVHLSRSDLQMVYLERGNTLVFLRLK
jgi:hypothetical protein